MYNNNLGNLKHKILHICFLEQTNFFPICLYALGSYIYTYDLYITHIFIPVRYFIKVEKCFCFVDLVRKKEVFFFGSGLIFLN